MNKIFYEHINSQSQSTCTIVFLHEGLGCTKSWGDYPKQLCEAVNMNGIVFDRAGYGRSPGNLDHRTNDYLIEAAKEAAEFIKSLHLNKIILYGHSDGGSIALAYVALYPEDILCIVAEAAHVINEIETKKGIILAKKAYELGKFKKLTEWHGNNLPMVFKAWVNTWLDDSFDLVSLKNLLPKITVDQLVIQGLKDQYGTAKQYVIIDKETNGKTTIFTPDCKHIPFMEAREEVLSIVSRFIKKARHENT
jgi:pimeloyl-ACP methyl ester carboxylesterase